MKGITCFIIAGACFAFALLNLDWQMYVHAGFSFLGAAGWYLACYLVRDEGE